MKLLVLGTSNSIMRDGWISSNELLARDMRITVDNQSIGAAPSLYLCYRLHDLNLLNDVDRVIIDFCINDQMFIDKGVYAIDRVEAMYFAAFRQLDQKGLLSRTLVLLFPQLGSFEQSEVPLIDAVRGLCQRFGVSFLDCREVIPAIASRRGETLEQAYADPRHMAPAYQKEIGEIALRMVRKSHFPGLTVRDNRRILRRFPHRCFYPLRVNECQKSEMRLVGTSFVRRTVKSLVYHSEAKVNGARFFVGMFFWCHDQSGAFCVTGATESRRFHLRRAWNRVFLFDAFQDPLELGEEASLIVRNDKDVRFELLQGQSSSIYECADSTVDLVSLVGTNWSYEELNAIVEDCKARSDVALMRRFRDRIFRIFSRKLSKPGNLA